MDRCLPSRTQPGPCLALSLGREHHELPQGVLSCFHFPDCCNQPQVQVSHKWATCEQHVNNNLVFGKIALELGIHSVVQRLNDVARVCGKCYAIYFSLCKCIKGFWACSRGMRVQNQEASSIWQPFHFSLLLQLNKEVLCDQLIKDFLCHPSRILPFRDKSGVFDKWKIK